MTYTIANNEQYNSIEITFDGKPCEAVRAALKANGYRWHGARRLWYGYTDAETISEAINAAAETPEEQNARAEVMRPAKKLASLWERCDVSKIEQHDKNTLPPVKEIAATIRKELRARFPEVKFSIKSGYNNIDAYILASPYERRHIMKDRRTGEPDKYGYYEDSAELGAVKKYCRALANSWNYDESDSMTDYFDVHFYGGYFETAGGYVQTEPTEEQTRDVADFEERKAEKEEKERAEFLAKCERDRIEREKAAEAARIQAQKDAETRAEIEKAVTVTDIPENERKIYFDLALFRKVGSLAETDEIAAEYASEGERLTFSDAVVSRRVDFGGYSDGNKELFESFCKMFLHDFSFLAGKGGTATNDARVKNPEIFEKLTPEQRDAVEWYATDCVGVYFNDVLQFVVDPEGYNYARYILTLPESFEFETDSENAAEWIKRSEERTSSAAAFYIPAPILEQVEKAALKRGENITVFKLDGWSMTVQETRGKLVEIGAKAFAQYPDAGYVDIIPAGKRKPTRIYFRAGESFVIFRGILPEMPDVLKYSNVGLDMRRARYAGETAPEYVKNAIRHYGLQGFAPAVDLVAR